MKQFIVKAQKTEEIEWVEGYLIDDGFDCYIKPEDDTINSVIETNKYNKCLMKVIPVDPQTVCRNTGMQDKNGREIWENDIVIYQYDPDDDPFPNPDTKKRKGKIFFSDFRGSWSVAEGKGGNPHINNDLYRYVQNGNRVEVIGNIFDHPELLQ